MTIEELYTKCEQADACQEGLDLIKSSASLEELYERAPAEFGYWLRRDVKDLPDEIRRKAELKACEEPRIAYWFCTEVKDLPEEIQRKAELKACEEPYYAHWLHTDVRDLHPDTIEKLKEKK
jgi:hypothetical protein